MNPFTLLVEAVAFWLKTLHSGLSTFLAPSSGPAWALSIILLTISVRILLFPLFVKQIKSQRRMQELAPKIKELQGKHKGDRETLNTELMKLYKDHGTNPISGCLPLIMQLPIFFALFKVMNEFKPQGGVFVGKYGLPSELIREGAHAKIFGAPISAAFNSPAKFVQELGGNVTSVKVVAVVMIVTMGLTTFLTQKQMMSRNGAAADAQQQQIQKIMLYVLPFSFAIFGFSFPIGVLLYWLTTNVWSLAQQQYVIARMPPVVPGAATAGKTGKDSKDAKATGGKAARGKDESPKGEDAARPEAPTTSTATVVATAGAGKGPAGSRPPAGRAAG
ncbi:MAG: 60 kDa inner rane insertion protein, partial [Frankiales bacterium]|nr:60 kDa inner rane insertion protein [Frankiales bacterium]